MTDNTETPQTRAEARSMETPNVVVQNPRVRKVAGIVLGVGSLVVSSAVVVDLASPAIEISAFTTPAAALVLFLGGVFGLGVTTPNVPRG